MDTGALPTEGRPEAIETPFGRLHRTLGAGYQALVFVGAFLGGPALGWAVGKIPGDLSETARAVVCVPFALVFFLGFAAWVARLKAIAFQGIGRHLLRALFLLIVRRRPPRSIEEVLPSRETLLRMAVRAQQAGGWFRRVGWVVGPAGGLAAALFESATTPATRFLLVSVPCVGWGYALALLARHGWLPIPEEA